MTSEVDHQLYPDTKLEDSSLRHSRGIKEDAKRKDTGNSGWLGSLKVIGNVVIRQRVWLPIRLS